MRASSVSAGTSIVSRTFPSTWTTSVTVSSAANAVSKRGPAADMHRVGVAQHRAPELLRGERCERRQHLCQRGLAGPARRPAGVERGPHLGCVRTISFEIATLNRNRSRSVGHPRDRAVRGAAPGSSAPPPRAATASPHGREHPAQPMVHTPGGGSASPAISFQSMSSSNGFANSIVSRIESAPHRSTSGISNTCLPDQLRPC